MSVVCPIQATIMAMLCQVMLFTGIIRPEPFISQSSPDYSPELIFHMKSRDQTSVLLSVNKSHKMSFDNTHKNLDFCLTLTYELWQLED